MKKSFYILFTTFALLFSTIGALLASPIESSVTAQAVKQKSTVVIDAGHGGEDGGASIYGEVTEKELNLLIAQNLADILRFAGFKVIMTRTEDILLYDKNSDYKGHKKSQDLANRLRIARESGGGILVSIHMNAFPEAKYSGLQVYYSKNDEASLLLAQKIQGYTKTTLLQSNERKVKAADSNIYLLDRYENVSVLIECGFMSNPDEYERLCSEEYQRQLAAVFFSAISDFEDSAENK